MGLLNSSLHLFYLNVIQYWKVLIKKMVYL